MLGDNNSIAEAVILSFVLIVSVVAMPLMSGVAAASQHDVVFDSTSGSSDGTEYDQGVVIEVQTSLAEGDTVELRENSDTGTAVNSYTVDADGNIYVDTTQADNGGSMEGDYYLYDTAGSASIGWFDVVRSDYDAEITASNDIFWQGQHLRFDDEGAFAEDETVTLRVAGGGDDDGDFIKEYNVENAGGSIYIDSGQLNLNGTYSIHNGSGTEVAVFETYEQDLTVSSDDTQLSNSGSDTQTTFTFDSNRSSYDVWVTEANDKLNAQDLDSIFGSGAVVQNATEEGEDRYQVTVSDSTELSADFSGVDKDSYSLEFTAPDTDATDSINVNVGSTNDADASFSQSVYSEQQGDIVNLTVNTDNASQFTVTFGDESTDNYTHSATFNVDDGVNQVKLQYNTFDATDAKKPFSVHEDSENDASISSQTTDPDLEGKLDAADYDIDVSVNGETKDTGLVTLTERSTSGSTAHIAPDVSTIDELSDLEEATEMNTVAMKDKFIFQVDASGLYGYLTEDTTAANLAADDDDDATDGSFDDKYGIYVEVEETNPAVNTQPNKLDVSQATLIRDAENDRFFLVFDEEDYPEISEDDTFDMKFHVTETNPYVENSDTEDNSQEVSSEMTFVERDITFNNMNDDDVVEVEQSEEAEVSANTTVAPNTEMTILARSGSPNAFTKSQTVSVASDQTVTATYNMSDVNEGQEFELTAREMSKTVDAVAVSGTSTLTVNVEDENGEAVNANVSVDGQSSTASDGTATFDLEDGSYTVSASADGFQDVSQSVTVEGDTSQTLTMTAEPTTYDYTVTVEDSNGEAVSGASVSMNGTTQSTGSSGAATFTVEEGSYTAQVSADGYQDASSSVTVSESSTSTTVTLEAEEPEPEEFTQTFTVEDSNGEAVSGATVEFAGMTKTTGDNGEVSFTTTEGDYDVSVSAEGYQSASDSVTLDSDGSSTVTLTASSTDDSGSGSDDGDSDGSGDSEDGENNDGGSGGGIGMAGVVLIIAALIGGAAVIYYNRQN